MKEQLLLLELEVPKEWDYTAIRTVATLLISKRRIGITMRWKMEERGDKNVLSFIDVYDVRELNAFEMLRHFVRKIKAAIVGERNLCMVVRFITIPLINN